MSKKIQAIRGMNDILPAQTPRWQHVEAQLSQIAQSHGYEQIRLPILEHTALFERSIGEVTDVVEKEMYTFEDKSGDSLTLRPEGTAGCVRAGIEHGLFHHQKQRLWYLGPMFRHERPQKGRYRQFHHFGVEVFGIENPEIDAELLNMTAMFWDALGVANDLILQINTLGSLEARKHYREYLVQYFQKHLAVLDEDSQRRLTTNPLRILDSKNPEMQEMILGAPKLMDFLDPASQEHFESLRRYLDHLNIPYEINPRLVRGLDYYCRTAFEWVTTKLGAQGTVCGGGRYDTLVEQLGGRPTPAMGFAVGLERLVLLLEESFLSSDSKRTVDMYLVMVGDTARLRGFSLARELHQKFPELRLLSHCGSEESFKTQFKQADKSGASIALILGEDEVAKNHLAVKYLREEKEQQHFPLGDIEFFIRAFLNR